VGVREAAEEGGMELKGPPGASVSQRREREPTEKSKRPQPEADDAADPNHRWHTNIHTRKTKHDTQTHTKTTTSNIITNRKQGKGRKRIDTPSPACLLLASSCASEVAAFKI
jgi:hypothetical protein